MIVGLGTDIVNIGRMERTAERYGDKFVNKLFTADEKVDIANADGTSYGRPAKMARMFAAKEAAAKALGTGFRNGIMWCDIEVKHDKLGRPLLVFYNKALAKAKKICGGDKFESWLSLSDDYPFAQAVAIIEKIS